MFTCLNYLKLKIETAIISRPQRERERDEQRFVCLPFEIKDLI